MHVVGAGITYPRGEMHNVHERHFLRQLYVGKGREDFCHYPANCMRIRSSGRI